MTGDLLVHFVPEKLRDFFLGGRNVILVQKIFIFRKFHFAFNLQFSLSELVFHI